MKLCTLKIWPPTVQTRPNAAPVTQQRFDYTCGFTGVLIWTSPEQAPTELVYHECEGKSAKQLTEGEWQKGKTLYEIFGKEEES